MEPCPHFKLCSGCISHLGEIPAVWNEILLACQPALTPQLIRGPAASWRTRAKLAVRGTARHPIIGLYKRGTHEAVSIPSCLVHHPRINQAIHLVEEWMKKHAIHPYHEESHRGELRYLQCVVQRSSGKVQLTLVVNEPIPKQHLESLYQSGDFWHSLWLNTNTRRTNTIFGEKWEPVFGEEYLWETFNGVEVCFQPAHFAQANLSLFERLLKKIGEWIPQDATVVEYFAGVGVIGLTLAAKSQSVKCVEVNPFAEEAFTLSKSRLPSKIQGKLAYYTGMADEHLGLLNEADTVIVDPPRKGLTPAFLHALKLAAPRQLIYVSCNWESFKRDWGALEKSGYKLDTLEGYALFPGSSHLEILANFINQLEGF